MQNGGECMILPNVSKEDAGKLFPGYRVEPMPSGKEYLRITSQPKWKTGIKNGLLIS